MKLSTFNVLSKSIEDYRRLSKTIEDYRRLSKTIEDYRRLLMTIKDYRSFKHDLICMNARQSRTLFTGALRYITHLWAARELEFLHAFSIRSSEAGYCYCKRDKMCELSLYSWTECLALPHCSDSTLIGKQWADHQNHHHFLNQTLSRNHLIILTIDFPLRFIIQPKSSTPTFYTLFCSSLPFLISHLE